MHHCMVLHPIYVQPGTTTKPEILDSDGMRSAMHKTAAKKILPFVQDNIQIIQLLNVRV